jgi:hypothetical protein
MQLPRIFAVFLSVRMVFCWTGEAASARAMDFGGWLVFWRVGEEWWERMAVRSLDRPGEVNASQKQTQKPSDCLLLEPWFLRVSCCLEKCFESIHAPEVWNLGRIESVACAPRGCMPRFLSCLHLVFRLVCCC